MKHKLIMENWRGYLKEQAASGQRLPNSWVQGGFAPRGGQVVDEVPPGEAAPDDLYPEFKKRMPQQMHRQMKHIQKYLHEMTHNFIVIDDANRRLYVFDPKGPKGEPKLLAVMPVITGRSKGDKTTLTINKFLENEGLLQTKIFLMKKARYYSSFGGMDKPSFLGDNKKWQEKLDNFNKRAFEAWLKAMNVSGQRVTDSGVWNITNIRNTPDNKKKKLDYGDTIISIQNPERPDSSIAIHGTNQPRRVRALKRAQKIFNKNPHSRNIKAVIKNSGGSYGCINVGKENLEKLKKLISKNGSKVFILPEDRRKILDYESFKEFDETTKKAESLWNRLKRIHKYPTRVANLMAQADKSKVKQVDPEDEKAVQRRMRRAGFNSVRKKEN